MLFRKRMKNNARLGIHRGATGYSASLVRHDPEVPPTLLLCQQQDAEQPLSRLVHRNHLERYPCIDVLGLEDYHLLLVEKPEVADEELADALRWRVRDLIPFPAEEAVIDTFPVPQRSGGAASGMIYAVVSRTGLVRSRVEELLEADLALEVIDIPELALRNIAALLPEAVAGVMCIYFSPDRALITVSRGDELYLSRHTRSGELGYQSLLQVVPDGRLSPELEGLLDALGVELQRTLDYYDRTFSQPPVAGIVVSPLPQPIEGMNEYLQSQLDIPVRTLDINRLLDCPEAIPPERQAGCLLALGGALRELEAVA